MILFERFLTVITQGFIIINHALSSTGCLLLAAFFLLILIFLKIFVREKTKSHLVQSDMPVILDVIAGEDIWMTQLDLARAFIEINQTTEAKTILDQVIQQGSSEQRQIALDLLARSAFAN